MSTLGARLKKLREQRRLTCREVAKQIGVSTSTYREWEYGRKISGEPYVQLSTVFGVSLFELMTGQGPSNADVMKSIQEAERHLREARKKLESFF